MTTFITCFENLSNNLKQHFLVQETKESPDFIFCNLHKSFANT